MWNISGIQMIRWCFLVHVIQEESNMHIYILGYEYYSKTHTVQNRKWGGADTNKAGSSINQISTTSTNYICLLGLLQMLLVNWRGGGQCLKYYNKMNEVGIMESHNSLLKHISGATNKHKNWPIFKLQEEDLWDKTGRWGQLQNPYSWKSKIWVMSPAGFGTKIDCASEGQGKFTWWID